MAASDAAPARPAAGAERAKTLAQTIVREYFAQEEAATVGTVVGQLVAVFIASVSDDDAEAEQALAIHVGAVRALVPVIRRLFQLREAPP